MSRFVILFYSILAVCCGAEGDDVLELKENRSFAKALSVISGKKVYGVDVDPASNCCGSDVKPYYAVDHFSEIRKVVYDNNKSYKSERAAVAACEKRLNEYYREKSMWKDISRAERVAYLAKAAEREEMRLKREGFVKTCTDLVTSEDRKEVSLLLLEAIRSSYNVNYSNNKIFHDRKKRRLKVARFENFYDMFIEGLLTNNEFKELLEKINVTQMTMEDFPTAVDLQKELKLNYKGYVSLRHHTYQKFLQEKLENKLKPMIDRFYDGIAGKLSEIDKRYTDSEIKNIGNITMRRRCAETVEATCLSEVCNFADEDLVAELKRKGKSKVAKSYKKLTDNPWFFHPQLDKEAVLCMIKKESAGKDFDPHVLNYFYCSAPAPRKYIDPEQLIKRERYREKGKEAKRLGKNVSKEYFPGIPISTAQGFGQMTWSTFNGERNAGNLPITSVQYFNDFDNDDVEKNFELFKLYSNFPIVQIELAFRMLNLTIKRRNNLEAGIALYNQDGKAKYLKQFRKCNSCLDKAQRRGSDFNDAALKCLGTVDNLWRGKGGKR
ncbi:MAG: hypothetical protein KAQ98_03505 [Bacteriovoracaceae bacterium]|nr:hypothetical protein [Bacteriovoracaceae bacterium]